MAASLVVLFSSGGQYHDKTEPPNSSVACLFLGNCRIPISQSWWPGIINVMSFEHDWKVSLLALPLSALSTFLWRRVDRCLRIPLGVLLHFVPCRAIIVPAAGPIGLLT